MKGGNRAPSFCPNHWKQVGDRAGDKRLVYAVAAVQLGTSKYAEMNGWTREKPHAPEECFEVVGECWVCFFGDTFLKNLDDFVANPPAWARPEKEGG